MKAFLATTCILVGALLASGCATKKYVRNTTTPIQAKVDQVGQQAAQNTQQIDATRTQLTQVDQRAQSGISAAQERAATADQHAAAADQHATQAMTQATQAAQSAQQANQGVEGLRNTVANLDDYQMQTSVTVPFAFNADQLSDQAKQDLDKLAEQIKQDKRYFVAVAGYTDATGAASYNLNLSRRRADAVMTYLASKHDIPIYRMQMIGLGEEKPVNEANTREARAENRRVEVKLFSADSAINSMSGSASRMEQNQGSSVPQR